MKRIVPLIVFGFLLGTLPAISQDLQPGRGGGSFVETDPIATPLANTAQSTANTASTNAATALAAAAAAEAGVADGSGVTDAAAFRTALGLGTAATQASSAFQAASAMLTSFAALNGTGGDLGVYLTAVNTAATFTLTSFGRSLMDDADAAAGRATLSAALEGVCGLDTFVTAVADDGAPTCTAVDASVVTYTPDVLANWANGVDPGDVSEGLDQLAAFRGSYYVCSGNETPCAIPYGVTYVRAESSSSDIAITLPTYTQGANYTVRVVRSSALNAVTVDAFGSETINGTSTARTFPALAWYGEAYASTNVGIGWMVTANATDAPAPYALAADPTLTGVAAWSWSSGVEVKTLTAADTFGTLNVGTAASNLLQLDSSAAIPTGVALSTSCAWTVDWNAERDGLASANGWTDGGTGTFSLEDDAAGIAREKIVPTGNVQAYISYASSIPLTADAFELEVDWIPGVATLQSAITWESDSDLTGKRIWVNSDQAVTDQVLGQRQITTIRKKSGVVGGLEIEVNGIKSNIYTYASLTNSSNPTPAISVGKRTGTGTTTNYVYAVRWRSGSWCSAPPWVRNTGDVVGVP